MNTLSEEEQRNKQLTKLKSRNESQITDLEENLSRESATRQDLERTRRRLENELKENLEQMVDKNTTLDDLKQRLAYADAELVKLQTRLDEELVAKAIIMKQVGRAFVADECFHIHPYHSVARQ